MNKEDVVYIQWNIPQSQERIPLAATWMSLEIHAKWNEKDKYHLTSVICGL